jgi:hypothetical protein
VLQFVHVFGFYMHSFTVTAFMALLFFNHLNKLPSLNVALSLDQGGFLSS